MEKIFWARFPTGHRLEVEVEYIGGSKRRIFRIVKIISIKLPTYRRGEDPENARSTIEKWILNNVYMILDKEVLDEPNTFPVRSVPPELKKGLPLAV